MPPKRPRAQAETFASVLTSVRSAWKLSRVDLARESGFSLRSLARWEHGELVPRRGLKPKLLGWVAARDYPACLRLAAALGETAPPDPRPPPPPPSPLPPALSAAPLEVAFFRVAESAGLPAAQLRPALVAFLAHALALGASVDEARAALAAR